PHYLEINEACGKVEQFIESIFPTQNPEALSLLQKGDTPEEDKKKAEQASEASKDVFYLFFAVFGTLAVITLIMFGIAYLAGARFDKILEELQKGNWFPADKGAIESPLANTNSNPHGEL
ncbi:hypothetical protein DH86_00003439, partial [Scytalidium sp. 3C]